MYVLIKKKKNTTYYFQRCSFLSSLCSRLSNTEAWVGIWPETPGQCVTQSAIL